MLKKNWKLISLFLLILFFSSSSKSLDDSDIFLDAVFLSAVKKSNHEKALRMIEEGISLNMNDSDSLTPLAYAFKNDDEELLQHKEGWLPKDRAGLFEFTTEVAVVPNTFPYKDCHYEGCTGVLV